MPTLLRVDASSRLRDSHSRALADHFVERWSRAHPQGEVRVRDLVREPLPHLGNDTITGFYTARPEQDAALREATALSDHLIREVVEADVILIGTPMYNFSIPSALKAWIDQVVRIGETFSFSPRAGFQGLVRGKPVYVISASGAVFSTEAMRPMDFLTPYLQTVLGFLGLTDVTFLPLEGSNQDPGAFERSRRAAVEAIDRLWVGG